MSLVLSAAWMLSSLAACESDTTDPKRATQHADAGAETEPLILHTDEFSVDPGQERYLCFTKTLEEDAVIGAYSVKGQPFVHHVVFVRTLAPEPDGFSECDVLFRQTWDPLFISGAGDSKLEFPRDAGHKLMKGTQLLVQLHLLNASDDPAHGNVDVLMHPTAAENPRPVSTYIFGTTDLHLPANQASEIEAMCEVKDSIELIAGFPHLHQLGTGLRFEGGKSADKMERLFTREPYSFDDQHMENVSIKLEPGDVTRVTCAYENTSSKEVTFGESTHNEMCFFVGFALDRDKLTTCLTRRQPGAQN